MEGVIYVVVTIGGVWTFFEALNHIFKWGLGPMRWLKTQTVGRFTRRIDRLVQQQVRVELDRQQAFASQRAKLALLEEGRRRKASGTTYPVDTTPTLERRLGDVETGLANISKDTTDNLSKLQVRIEAVEKVFETWIPQAARALQDQYRRGLERLRDLTQEEKDVLLRYIRLATHTQEFPSLQQGVIRGLVRADILYRTGASPLGMLTFNIADWAFELLTQYPGLVGFDPKAELQKVHDEAVRRLARQPEPREWREVAGVQADLGHFDLIDTATGLPRSIRSQADLDTYMPVQD